MINWLWKTWRPKRCQNLLFIVICCCINGSFSYLWQNSSFHHLNEENIMLQRELDFKSIQHVDSLSLSLSMYLYIILYYIYMWSCNFLQINPFTWPLHPPGISGQQWQPGQEKLQPKRSNEIRGSSNLDALHSKWPFYPCLLKILEIKKQQKIHFILIIIYFLKYNPYQSTWILFTVTPSCTVINYISTHTSDHELTQMPLIP